MQWLAATSPAGLVLDDPFVPIGGVDPEFAKPFHGAASSHNVGDVLQKLAGSALYAEQVATATLRDEGSAGAPLLDMFPISRVAR